MVWRFVKLQKVKISQFGAFAKLQKAKSLGLELLLNYKRQNLSVWSLCKITKG